MKKEFIFLGPPASGKGTQTSKLAEHLGFPHIDTGSLLRAEIKAGTPDGLTAKSYIDKGNLVPLEIVASMIKSRLSQDDCKEGYILDGFPRSIEQADMLEKINNEIDKEPAEFIAVYFDIDQDVLIDRIINRRYCPKCGRIYNVKFRPPVTNKERCRCGGELVKRADDTKETAEARFKTYFSETAPLIDYYKERGVLKTMDANGDARQVWEKLLEAIK